MKIAQFIYILLFIYQINLVHAHEWQALITDSISINHIAINPHNPDEILASSDTNLFKTQDGGNTWATIIEENIIDPIQKIAFNPQNPQIIYIATGNYVDDIYRSSEIYQSQDAGISWQKLEKIFIPGIVDLKVNLNKPNILYVLTITGLFYKSIDAGKSWGEAVNSCGHTAVTSADMMVLHPYNPDIIYVALLQTPFSPTDEGLFQSTNQGDTWKQINGRYIFQNIDAEYLSIAINPHNPLIFYLGMADNLTIYKSIDGGSTGFEINEDQLQLTTETVQINPHQPEIVYLGTTTGLYRTINGGEAWTLLASNNNGKELHIKTIAIDPFQPNTLYIGTAEQGLYRFTATEKCIANYDSETAKVSIPCMTSNHETLQYQVELQKRKAEPLFEVSQVQANP
ncbi:hypothetical protein [Candidatus Albibeggiatoa sp. nov. BB20]|uniref:WD40/YVTN/BNR-like repeat-containing protein n=1 Tax=Candidatus Albibeggiatoa sp. nov. BB20 TaxID=3162723 RepID=UPI0033657317